MIQHFGPRLCLWATGRLFLFSSPAASQAGSISMPSWTQGRSDAGSDGFVDVSLDPSLFQVDWHAAMPAGRGNAQKKESDAPNGLGFGYSA